MLIYPAGPYNDPEVFVIQLRSGGDEGEPPVDHGGDDDKVVVHGASASVSCCCLVRAASSGYAAGSKSAPRRLAHPQLNPNSGKYLGPALARLPRQSAFSPSPKPVRAAAPDLLTVLLALNVETQLHRGYQSGSKASRCDTGSGQ